MAEQPIRQDIFESPYGYTPTAWVCITFMVLFGISTLAHVGQMVRYRLWWMLVTAVCCGIGELLGWGGRYWEYRDPHEKTAFLIQISVLIFSPTFLFAAIFITFGRIINIMGARYSRLSPAAYSYIFLTMDCAALIVQGVGGGMASAAVTVEGAERGGRVMLGGILLQLVVVVFFILFAVEFFIRVSRNAPVRSLGFPTRNKETTDTSGTATPVPTTWYRAVKLQVIGLGITILWLSVRTLYRTVELQDGWRGSIIRNETLFNVLDGLPIILAMFTMNVFHPGALVFNTSSVKPAEKVTDVELNDAHTRV